MVRFGRIAPASFWRAFFVCTLLPITGLFSATPGAPAPPARGGPDAAAAAQILQRVREADIEGDYYWEFELHALPRRGEQRVYQGRGWGERNEKGPIKRIELTDATGRKLRLLLQNGEHSAMWRWADGRVSTLGPADLFTPVIPGVELTAFDLQMPFLFWPNATLEGVEKSRGREAHVFVLRPPPEFSAPNSPVAAVRVFIDEQLNAILQTELLDRNNRVLKRFSPQSLKTVEKQPLPKTVDFRSEASGNKARIELTAIALGLNHSPALFQPASLEEDIRPSTGKLVRID